MKKRFGLGAAWLLATALAVGVASQAVGLVADRAVGIPVQVPVAVAGQSSFGPITAPPTDPTTPTTASNRSTTMVVPATSTTAPATSTSTAPTSVSGTTTTTVPAATTTTMPAPPTTTSPAPLDSRTYFLEGGQVSAACTGPDTVQYLGGFPQPGWSMELEASGPDKVRVDFESGEEEEESEIEIVCTSGQLHEDISD